LAELVEAGPDLAVHGVVRWRRVDLRDELQRRFGVALHERSVGKVLAKLATANCRKARHPKLTKKPRRHFKKLRRDSHGANPRPRKGKPIEIMVPR